MKHVPLALIACALVAACGAASSPVGVWKIDPSSVPEDARKDPNMMDGIGQLEMEFKADGTAVTTTPLGQKTYKWTIKDRIINLFDTDGKVQVATLRPDDKINLPITGTLMRK